MFCNKCGAQNEEGTLFCTTCGSNLQQQAMTPEIPATGGTGATVAFGYAISPKDKGVLIILAGLLGSLGIDRFYRGQIGMGLLKLFTGGGCGIWALIDYFIYALGENVLDADGKVIIDRKTYDYVRSKGL